ncbi:spore germination protein [Brevibacillus humidisoli]|uniref:spore germination protein n=1 Tax=Brevibacillus humidisoli TaxID=2895522 RepID=UPI001E53A00F|nr:spore germination protein [Brevibacillus humidisoli]UFJ42624.1 spore germination protein [Brevibacillus humidisoli]
MNHHARTTAQAKNREVSPDIHENEHWIKQAFTRCEDVKIKQHPPGRAPEHSALLIYCSGMINYEKLETDVLPKLDAWLLKEIAIETSTSTHPIPVFMENWEVNQGTLLDDIVLRVFSGELVLFVDGIATYYAINIAKIPQRDPEETKTEISVRGPRDGLIEEIGVNVALIRKRLRTESFKYEQYVIGARSNTKVGLLYIDDIVNRDILQKVRDRLSQIQTDALTSIVQLEELLLPSSYVLFPMFNYTGRPDFAASSLLRGRFAIVMDGAPTAIIGPVNLLFLLDSAADKQMLFFIPAAERLIRVIGLLISLLLPGFWIALATYHQDQIPLSLLATIVEARKGVPFPTPLEAFLMLALFELFREAGLRLPAPVGPTLSVVGGLIIGDAAIRSGLTSPAMVVISAVTAVSSFTLVNQSLNGTITLLRLVVLLASSVLGLFGFLISSFAILLYLAALRSFGIPYLAPLSPISWTDLIKSVLNVPTKKMNRRPNLLMVRDQDRQPQRSSDE